MNYLLFFATVLNCSFVSYSYVIFYRRRYLFSDRFGFTLTFSASTIFSFVLSINFFLLFPASSSLVSTLTLIGGMIIGALFGTMVTMQSLIAGVFNGGIGAIMGSMFAAVALDPSLCGLPTNLWTEQSMILFMTLTSLVIQILTVTMLTFAYRL